jgi:dinuclear metal center YbgI/SA1388 family protein
MKVTDLVQAMEAIAPARFAASWDNVGLLVGDGAAVLSRVLLTVDCTQPVVEEARRDGCDAIVTYHPILFAAQKSFVAGSMAYEVARAGVAVFSPHTALDAASGGTNDVLADAIAMTHRAPLRAAPVSGASVAADAASNTSRSPDPAPGFGRVGAVAASPVRALVAGIKRSLGVSHVLVAGPSDRTVTRAAVCAGSGGDLLPDAIEAGVELMLTGELRHHDALRAVAAGLTVVCTLHSASERCVLAALQRRLMSHLPGVAVACSTADREPFSFA